MGNCCDICNRKRQKNITILLTGLDNAGKTTIAKKLAGEPIDSVLPTVGFSLIVLHHYGYKITVYDLGGGPQIRDIWNKYFPDAHGIIYVTDASDMTKLGESKVVFANLLAHENVSGKPILLLANKQDRENSLDEIEIVEQLDIEYVVNKYRCPTRVEICIAHTPDTIKIDKGIKNGFRWLINHVIQNYKIIDQRVQCDMQESLTLIEKRREEWRKKIKSIENERYENGETIFENGDPFKPIRTVIKTIEDDDRGKQTEASRKHAVLVDNFVKNQIVDANNTGCLRSRKIDNGGTSSTVTIITKSQKQKLKKFRHRYYRKKFGRSNKTAPMPMELLTEEQMSDAKKRAIWTKSCLSYGFEMKSKRTRILSSIRRPATAPPKMNFSSLKVETVWNSDVSLQTQMTTCSPSTSRIEGGISHIL